MATIFVLILRFNPVSGTFSEVLVYLDRIYILVFFVKAIAKSNQGTH